MVSVFISGFQSNENIPNCDILCLFKLFCCLVTSCTKELFLTYTLFKRRTSSIVSVILNIWQFSNIWYFGLTMLNIFFCLRHFRLSSGFTQRWRLVKYCCGMVNFRALFGFKQLTEVKWYKASLLQSKCFISSEAIKFSASESHLALNFYKAVVLKTVLLRLSITLLWQLPYHPKT